MDKEKTKSPNENIDPYSDVASSSRKRGNEGGSPVSRRKNDELPIDEASSSNGPLSKKHRRTPTFDRGDDRDNYAVAGRVAGIQLTNFMCHGNLEINFQTKGNNCFYIGGPNGSGKSALFAAINIGLGGRGSDNDRGNQVKTYIKDGTSSAKIKVTLTNDGENAHPEYGEYVVIERSINQSSSTYVVKSIEGRGRGQTEKIVSKKKVDVDRLVNRFNIHLSNPAFWMSQDRSRSFLANFKPANVYKLYQEATDLDKIKDSYFRFAGTLEELATIICTKDGDLIRRSKELKRLQEVRNLHDQLEKDKKEIDKIRWFLLYCPLRDVKQEYEMWKKKLDKNSEIFQQNRDNIIRNRELRTEAMRKVEVALEEVDEKKDEFKDVKVDLEELQERKRSEEAKLKAMNSEMALKKDSGRKLEQRIGQHKQRLDEAIERAGRNDMKARLDELEKKRAQVVKQREEMEHSGQAVQLGEAQEEADNALKDAELREYEIKKKLVAMRKELDANKDQLRRARAMKENQINKYGPQMAQIVDMIEREKARFDKLPKGPIGRYVKVLDPKWAFALEESIGSIAYQFLCHSAKDANTLRRIFEQLRIPPKDRPQLIVTRFLGRAHSNLYEPPSNYLTILRALQIEDVDVHNALIDKANIETIMLIERDAEAMQLMDRRPPQNATRAYTLNGSQAYAGGNMGTYRFYACNKRDTRPRGCFEGVNDEAEVDEKQIEHLIRQCDQEMHRMSNSDLREADLACRQARGQKNAVQRDVQRFDAQINESRRRELIVEREIADIERTIAEGQEEEEINNLRRSLEDLEGRLQPIQEQFEELRTKETDIRKIIRQTEAKLAGLEQQEAIHKEEMQRERRKLDVLRDNVSNLDAEHTKYDNMSTRLETDKQKLFEEEIQLRVKTDDVQAKIDEKRATMAVPTGVDDPPNLDDFMPTEQAHKFYRQKQAQIEAANQEIDPTITMEMVRDFKTALKEEKVLVKRIREITGRMNQLLKSRVAMYPLLRRYTEMKVRHRFADLLSYCFFKGDLDINNEKRRLDVIVDTSKGKRFADAEDGLPMSQELLLGDNEVDSDDDDEYSSDEDEDDDDEPTRKKAKKVNKKKKKKGAKKDLKSLSGGERSFVTAALVMALWEVMEQPFRMMDEFDVFMDMYNRRIVMDLLVEMATKKFPHNQFIFFTPQGIKELKKVDGLQIFEMPKVRP